MVTVDASRSWRSILLRQTGNRRANERPPPRFGPSFKISQSRERTVNESATKPLKDANWFANRTSWNHDTASDGRWRRLSSDTGLWIRRQVQGETVISGSCRATADAPACDWRQGLEEPASNLGGRRNKILAGRELRRDLGRAGIRRRADALWRRWHAWAQLGAPNRVGNHGPDPIR